MRILVTGVCGFVGSVICQRLRDSLNDAFLIGIDNLSRKGSELNRATAEHLCDHFAHGDLRSAADVMELPKADWVVDCAALPSVLAGTQGFGSSRQLVENNLLSTLQLLEYCRTFTSGLILLSTSRVYSIDPLSKLNLREGDGRYELDDHGGLPAGLTNAGISELFSTAAPISLYGATKLSSETMALEYGIAFDFPVRINRCGVLAGARQFGRADQGIFSFWIHSHLSRRPLRYIGCGGTGYQVRDCLHPVDVADLIIKQIAAGDDPSQPALCNVSGGQNNSMSLAQLTAWCDHQFGTHPVIGSETTRPYDLPWIILDSALADEHWNWTPSRSIESILIEIAEFAKQNPRWLELSS